MKHISICKFAKRATQLNFASYNPFADRNGGIKSLDIGICVSGGPDSMALAYLLRNTPHPLESNSKAFRPHAYIVDHGARTGSAEEALLVQTHMNDMGIFSEILKLEHPEDFDPRGSAFETWARNHRYHVISQSARRHRQFDIFAGHHQDDQLETMLLRIIRGASGGYVNPMSLRGMQESSQLPTAAALPLGKLAPLFEVTCAGQATSDRKIVMEEVFKNGLQLHRPLLYYSKAQILATCQHYDIPYVIDKTNKDPTFAVRNTVRSIRTRNLPAALRSSRLVALQQHASIQFAKIEQGAKDLCANISRLRLRSSIGVLEVSIRLPTDRSNVLATSYLFGRLIDFVSPLPNDDVGNMLDTEDIEALIARVTPLHIARASRLGSGNSADRNGARFIRTPAVAPVCMTAKTLMHSRRVRQKAPHGEIQLSISRQPMRETEISGNIRRFKLDESMMPNHAYCSRLLIWDHRFAIRIFADEKELVSRFHIKSGVEARIEIDKVRRDKVLREALKDVAGHVAYTLPVLFWDDEPVALPTIGISFRKSLPVRCEVNYIRSGRAIDFLSAAFSGLSDQMAFIRTDGQVSWKTLHPVMQNESTRSKTILIDTAQRSQLMSDRKSAKPRPR